MVGVHVDDLIVIGQDDDEEIFEKEIVSQYIRQRRIGRLSQDSD